MIVPVLLVCAGLGLIIPGLVLMREGLFHFGVTLPVLLGAMLVAIAMGWRPIRHWCGQSVWRRRLWVSGWGALCLWLVSVAVFFFHISRLSETDSTVLAAPIALIVLGAGSPRCEVSPTLRARLDVAYAAATRWSRAILVVSGGKDLLGRPCSEAEVMRTALIAKGMAPERILLEDRSTSTAENFVFSKVVLSHAGVSAALPIAFVTNDFHGARALRIGTNAGFDRLEFVPAPTPFPYRYHAWLREYFASLSSWILQEG